MKFQKWIFLASIILFLGAIALVAFTVLTPFALAQGPGWFGPGNGGGSAFGQGSGQGFGMEPGNGPMSGGNFGPGFGMGRGRGGMMFGDNFGPDFGMGPGGGRGGMMGRWGGPDNGLISVAAKKLGLTSQELLTELQAGKTIADVAKEKNVAVETIVEAVLAPQAGWLKGMVDSEQLTQEQADAQLALLKANVTRQISEARPLVGRWGGPENSLLSVAAEKLALSSQELLTELQAGKTMADVAKEKDVAVETIVEAVLAPRTEQLKQAVTAGQLTQEQADARLALIKANLTQRMSEAWPQGRGWGYTDEDVNGVCDCMGPGPMGGRRGGGRMMGNWGW